MLFRIWMLNLTKNKIAALAIKNPFEALFDSNVRVKIYCKRPIVKVWKHIVYKCWKYISVENVFPFLVLYVVFCSKSAWNVVFTTHSKNVNSLF